MKRSTSLLINISMVLWLLWIFIDYWFKHPLYASSFGNTYAAIPMIHVITGLLAFYALYTFKQYFLSGAVLIGVFLAFLWSGTLVNLLMYSDVAYTASSIGMYLLRTLSFVGLVSIFIFSSYHAGRGVLNILFLSEIRLSSSVYAATGFALFMAIFFLFLVIGMFSPWTIGAIILLPLVVNFEYARETTLQLVKPMPDIKIGWLGIVCILLLVLMNAITFGYTLSPFPQGFDALNYYVNLPKLMAESGSLLPGYQPYNWSLLQAAGMKLTGRVEFALIFSWMGLLMVQWSTFEVGRRIMKLPIDTCLLAVALFTFMPAVTTQASQELKVDLGLTFMILAMLQAGFSLLSYLKSSEPVKRTMFALAVLVGVLGGVALGIKLTAVIALFAVVAILWYDRLGTMAFFGVFLICLAMIFLAQLDSKAGLRSYHASVAWLQWVALAGGLFCFAYASLKKVKLAIHTIVLSLVLTLGSIVAFSPWMIKNYSESKKPSFMEIINGTNQGPIFNIRVIDKNLKKKQRRQNQN